jgi:hypothetical protein
MTGIRALKQTARLALHRAMQWPALYITDAGTQIQCGVRKHTDNKALGDVKGTSFGYAERAEVIPRLVFLAGEVDPVNGATVSIALGEAYHIDNVLPPDGITVTCEVSRLSARDAEGLPLPVESV